MEKVMRQLPPLAALRVFEMVAREGSVSRAAIELGMTAGAVSKQVLKLEAWFGRQLFHRAGRGLQLAPVGADLLRDLTPALDRIELASRLIEAGRQPDVLRVTAPPTFMTHWLIPRLGQFQQLYPGISIQLDNRRDQVRGLPDRTDLAIRRGSLEAAGLSVVPLMPEAVTPACRPDLPGLEALRKPTDLAEMTWLSATMRPIASLSTTPIWHWARQRTCWASPWRRSISSSRICRAADWSPPSSTSYARKKATTSFTRPPVRTRQPFARSRIGLRPKAPSTRPSVLDADPGTVRHS
jgi:DNA-binding transcriptional LysR family regulator